MKTKYTFLVCAGLLAGGTANAEIVKTRLGNFDTDTVCVEGPGSKQYRVDVEELGCQLHGAGTTCTDFKGSRERMRDWLWGQVSVELTALEFFQQIADGQSSRFSASAPPNCPLVGTQAPDVEDIIRNQCVVISCDNYTPPAASGGGTSVQSEGPAQFDWDFALRSTSDDLTVPIKTAGPAKFAFTRNYETGGNRFSTQATVGVPVKGHTVKTEDGRLYNPFTFVPFLGITRVEDTRGNDVTNLSAGLGFQYSFWSPHVFGGAVHAFDFSSELVSDEELDSLILDGTFIYRPYPKYNIFTQGQPLGPLRLLLQPALRADVGRVFDPGTKTALQTTEDYIRAGGSLKALLFYDDGTDGDSFLEAFELTLDYTYTHGFEGALDEFQRFEASFNYSLPGFENVGLGISYVNGDIATTLEEEERLQAEITLKF